jgi:hypothetical protein
MDTAVYEPLTAISQSLILVRRARFAVAHIPNTTAMTNKKNNKPTSAIITSI